MITFHKIEATVLVCFFDKKTSFAIVELYFENKKCARATTNVLNQMHPSFVGIEFNCKIC